ncbi:MAG: hypothetical protein WDZ72_13115 [Cyclobacteriaceae bacterium]
MNSQEFLSLIKNGNQLDAEGFRSANKLHENFPYFLIPKILAAKHEWQQSQGKSSELLHSAAILSPDRKRLKQLIEKPLNFLPEEIINPDSRIPNSDRAVSPDEKSPELETGTPPETEMEKPMEKEMEEPVAKPKREEILRRLEENLKKIKKTGSTKEITPEEKKKEEKPEEIMLPPVGEGEDLISSIERKNIIRPLDDRDGRDGQNEIIEKFKEKPIRLSRDKIEEYDELPDLSEKSTALNENTVSESFAKLLVKQGKKEEASVIYQKLILKFPEKSTYFADQISKLKAKNT